MQTLDRFLSHLAKTPFDVLLLAPGRPPIVRRGEEDSPAGRTPLASETIGRLIQEVAPAGLDDASQPWSFERSVGDASFVLSGRSGAGGLEVEVVPVARTAHGAGDGKAAAAVPSGTLPFSPRGGRLPEAAPAAPTLAAPEPAPAPAAASSANPLEPLLLELLDRRGSDLHLTSGQPPRARIDGELVTLDGRPAPSADELARMLAAVTPAKNREELAERHDTDFGLELPGRARFRVNLFRDHAGVGAVFRQIPTKIPTAEDLRLPPAVAALSDLARGLVLVTGPTGSGKSTTLAAIVDRANRTRADHIITIEDPIEFVHPSRRCLVHQREVGTHTRSFATALRAALREDPDVVLVGEMRDLETTRVAIETAETGHLVFGTLHTTSAAATVERLINQYPEGEQAQIRLMLAGTLKAVVAQTLLKRIGGGRVAAYEVLLVSPAIANLIREGKVFQIPSMMQTGRAGGMTLLDESLLTLVREGLVEPEEAWRKAAEKKDFAARLRGAGVRLDGVDGGEAGDEARLRRVG